MTTPGLKLKCPICGGTDIVFVGHSDRWICMQCNKPFTEKEYKATLKSKEGGQTAADSTNEEDESKNNQKGGRDHDAFLTSRKGGFLVDREMIRGGRQ